MSVSISSCMLLVNRAYPIHAHLARWQSWTYLNQVNFIESLVVTGPLNIQDGDDVFVVKVSQQLHLTQCTQAEHGVIEWRDLLDGNLLARGLMNGRAAWS